MDNESVLFFQDARPNVPKTELDSICKWVGLIADPFFISFY